MELQWPLILFTTFVAWSAGLFGAQGAAALAGEGRRAQMPALIGSAALLAVGGVAVFFHLEHFERIFNGFGNPTSGITQELVCVVVVGALMVVAFVVLRRAAGGDEAPALPKWLAALMIAAAALLVLVTGHSYMMAARPAWDSLLGPLTLLGAACAAGPLTFAAIGAIAGGADGAVAGGAPGAAPARAAGRAVGIAAILGSQRRPLGRLLGVHGGLHRLPHRRGLLLRPHPSHRGHGGRLRSLALRGRLPARGRGGGRSSSRAGGLCDCGPQDRQLEGLGRRGRSLRRGGRRGPAHGFLLRRRQRVFVLLA